MHTGAAKQIKHRFPNSALHYGLATGSPQLADPAPADEFGTGRLEIGLVLPLACMAPLFVEQGLDGLVAAAFAPRLAAGRALPGAVGSLLPHLFPAAPPRRRRPALIAAMHRILGPSTLVVGESRRTL